jgi:hypothetical protein
VALGSIEKVKIGVRGGHVDEAASPKIELHKKDVQFC